MSNLEKKSISAENTYTDPLKVSAGNLPVFVHTEGTWKGIISIQVKHPEDTSWFTMSESVSTRNFETIADKLPIDAQVRVGFEAGNYDSGTATIRVMQ